MPADMKPIAASARRLADDHPPVRTVALRAVHESVGGPTPTAAATHPLSISLTAALIAIRHDAPMVLATMNGMHDALPSSQYQSAGHPTLDGCLRSAVATQTGLAIGHAEQLLAFADHANGLAIGYLALTRATVAIPQGAQWRSWCPFANAAAPLSALCVDSSP